MTASSNNKSGKGRRASTRRTGPTVDLKANEVKANEVKNETAGKEAAAQTDKSAETADPSSSAKTEFRKKEAGASFSSRGLSSLASAGDRLRGPFGGGKDGGGHLWRTAALLLCAAILGGAATLAGWTLLRSNQAPIDMGRLAAVESRLDERETASEQVGLRIAEQQDAIASLSSRLTESVEQAVQPDRELQTRLSELDGRVSVLENVFSQLESSRENGDTSALTTLAGRLADLESRLTDVQQNLSSETQPADNGRLGDIAERAQENNQAIDAVAARTDALERRLDALADRVEKADSQAQDSEMLARRMAAEALRTAYRRGGAFAQLLDTAQSMTNDNEAIAKLRPVASEGVVSDVELQRGFDAVAGDIMAAGQEPATGVVDRFMQSARSLVTVRPTGPVEGDTPAAKVWRIEQALKAGELGQAYKTWQSLPPPAREISADWAARLQTRIETDAALEALVSELIGGR